MTIRSLAIGLTILLATASAADAQEPRELIRPPFGDSFTVVLPGDALRTTIFATTSLRFELSCTRQVDEAGATRIVSSAFIHGPARGPNRARIVDGGVGWAADHHNFTPGENTWFYTMLFVPFGPELDEVDDLDVGTVLPRVLNIPEIKVQAGASRREFIWLAEANVMMGFHGPGQDCVFQVVRRNRG